MTNCGCTAQTRCPVAAHLRQAYRAARRLPDAQEHRRIRAAYTTHLQACGLLDGYGPETEVWPRVDVE